MLTNADSAAPATLPLVRLQETVQRLMPGWGAVVEGFHYLDGGYANANYLFRYANERFVLRSQPSDQPLEATNGLASEIQLRALLNGQANLSIAPLIAADVTLGEMITGFVDGPLLAKQPPLPREAAAYLRHLHEQLLPISAPAHYNLQSLIQRWLPQPPSWLHAYLRDGADQQRLSEGPLQCCHNDLNPWNIIRSCEQPQGWTTLDWETAATAHPIFDAVTLHQGIAAERAGAQARVVANGVALSHATPQWPSLAEFCDLALVVPVSAEQITAALRSYWLREYAWAAAQLRQGSQNPAIAAQERLAQHQLQLHLQLQL